MEILGKGLRAMFVGAACVAAGCSATTTITGSAPATIVKIDKREVINTPRTESMSTTTFGNYLFKAELAGAAPFYGVLPLKFNGGYLAADILLFAPATMFNLREVYPYYEFDVVQHVVRFKKDKDEEWHTYVPLAAEADRARKAMP